MWSLDEYKIWGESLVGGWTTHVQSQSGHKPGTTIVVDEAQRQPAGWILSCLGEVSLLFYLGIQLMGGVNFTLHIYTYIEKQKEHNNYESQRCNKWQNIHLKYSYGSNKNTNLKYVWSAQNDEGKHVIQRTETNGNTNSNGKQC